jgi:cytoskeletal protein RodZ
MRTVGEILTEARNKKNLTLGQVERETRIRKKILQKLEGGEWTSLAPTYIKGLLKNYASYLGLEEKRILAFFRREYDERKQTETAKRFEKIKPKFRLTPATLTFLLVGFLVASVLLYLFYQYRSFTAAPVLEVQEPTNNTKISSFEVSVVGRTLNDSVLKINGERVQVSPGGTFSVVVGLKEGVNTLTITSANRFGNINTVKRTVIVESSGPEKTPTTRGEPLNLKLRIEEKSTFLKIEVDGKTTFEGLMLAGSNKNFQATEKIKITSEDAGSTIVNFRGEEFSLGERGEKVVREFTLD